MIGALSLLTYYCWISSATAQSPVTAIAPLDVADIAAPTFSVYTTDDGLSDEIWNSIGFDGQGFVWAGSASTIARFDGRRWLVWPMPAPIGLTRDLLTDESGDLWAIFERGGLARYHNEHWELGAERRYYYGFSQTLQADGGIDRWLTRDQKLLRLVNGRWLEDGGNLSLPEGNVSAMEQTQTLFGEQRQWLGRNEADTGLVYRRVVAGSTPEPWLKFTAPELRYTNTNDLLSTRDRGGESLWGTAYGVGIFRIRDDGIRVWSTATGELPTDAVYDIEAGTDNGVTTVWVASRAGLLRIRDDQVTVFDRRHGLPSNAVRRVRLQRINGLDVLWLATENGVARAVLSQSQWQSVSLHGARENGIFGVLVEPDGSGGERLWTGSATEGLAVLQQGQWRIFEQTQTGLRLAHIRQIRRLPGPDGQDWRLLSLMGGELLRIDDDFKFTPMVVPWPNDSDEGVVGMHARTGELGRELWFGMMTGGAYRLAGGQWQHFPDPAGSSNWRVFAFADQIDLHGRAWLWAATDHGLARFDGQDWMLLPDELGLSDGLRGVTLIPDAGHDILWLGTLLRGVVRLDVTDPTSPFAVADTKVPPAPDAVVYSVLPDSQGRIYVCTNNGVQLLSPGQDGSYSEQVYRRTDGLIHDECNTNSQLVDAHDRYWVGTLGGLGLFDPRTETSAADKAPKPLRVTEIRIDARLIPKPYPAEISVPADSRELRIGFALLSGMRESENRYRTWLRGEEEAPGEWSREADRSFSRLSPGDYELQIEARDYNGTLATPLLLKLRVLAPWWRSAWASALAPLLGLLTVGVAVLIYNRGLRARQRQLKRLVANQTAELNAANEELTRLSYQDALTGVANRRRLTEAMDAAIAWAIEQGKPIGLILVDVDHFKQYNDRFGHLAGDVALGAVAQAMRSAVREQDLVARFGGEEFACLLLDADSTVVGQIAERMRLLVQALPPRTIGNDRQTLTISVGTLCTTPTRSMGTAALMEAADQALYQAKADGRNCVRTADTKRPRGPSAID